MSFERANIHSMHGYVPGEQPQDGDVIKLNTNENPYPAPGAVAEALAAINTDQLRRYPSPTATEFRHVAARLHDVLPENIIPTNGGDELLRLAITTFANAGDTIGIAVPSYSLYSVLAEIQGCNLLSIPLQDDWQLPGDFASKLNDSGAKLAMLVNPHAPSGTLTSAHRLAKIAAAFKGVLLVDEAYVDFVDTQNEYNLIPLIKSLDNLLILRTLSKGYSLAGLRFGYGIGSAKLLEPLMFKTRDSYNTDFIAQRLATAALSAASIAAVSWSKVRNERQRMIKSLEKLGISCPASQSNFVLAQVTGPLSAKSMYEQLKARKILVRYFDQDKLRDKLRITIGTEQQNQFLLENIAQLIQSQS